MVHVMERQHKVITEWMNNNDFYMDTRLWGATSLTIEQQLLNYILRIAEMLLSRSFSKHNETWTRNVTRIKTEQEPLSWILRVTEMSRNTSNI